jgi:cysteine-rich repeat protein
MLPFKASNVVFLCLLVSFYIESGHSTAFNGITFTFEVGYPTANLSTVDFDAERNLFASVLNARALTACVPANCQHLNYSFTIPAFDTVPTADLGGVTTYEVPIMVEFATDEAGLHVIADDFGQHFEGVSFSDISEITAVSGTVYPATTGRPAACGDFDLQTSEQCDDGNLNAGDGCDENCDLEAGYMCKYSIRSVENASIPGVRYQWHPNKTLTVGSNVEACRGEDICTQGAVWMPQDWQDLYTYGTELPPAGVYCSLMCKMFPVPYGYTVNDNCQLVDINECNQGTAACSTNALCVNKLPSETSTNLGYECFCDPNYFTSEIRGLGCTMSGVEIQVVVAGQPNFDDTMMDTERSSVAGVREAFIDLLIAQNYTTAPRAVLLEGLLEYDVELLSASGGSLYPGRALWNFKVRISSTQTNLQLISAGSLWRDNTLLETVLSDSSQNVSMFLMHERKKCANDHLRDCTADADCLDGAVCLQSVPDISINILTSGGTEDAVEIGSSGMELISISYDVTKTAWTARMRYDDTVPNVLDVVFVSHVEPPVNAVEQATFNVAEFPCLPIGTGIFERRREDSVCCLNQVSELYTTTQGFNDYVDDTSLPLGMSLAREGACVDGARPPNATNDLVDTTQDFVEGPLARMSRSTATLDTVNSHGYKDIILFLAEEDVRRFGGIQTNLEGGFRIEFFVGMMHVRTLTSDALSTSFSKFKVTSEITQTYIFTTTGETEFSFVEDINVQLLQVKHNDIYLKFAKVQLTLPAGMTGPADGQYIPHASARASMGFSVESSSAPVYPCLDSALGDIRGVLDGLGSCAFSDALCAPLGPDAIGAGRQFYYVFPLPNTYWDDASLENAGLLLQSVFLDFIITGTDPDGKLIMDRVRTRTELSRIAISSLCDSQNIIASIDDIMDIDLYLGLTPTEDLFDASLVKSLDITSSSGTINLRREESSKATNLLTMVIQGSEDTFAEAYAAEYALRLEDMFTVHFLDSTKQQSALQMLDAGLAFDTFVPPVGSDSVQRLVPSDALLDLCPVQSTRNVFGCITRRDVQDRVHDVVTQSIFMFSPRTTDAAQRESTYQAAGHWLQTFLGGSDYVQELGANHSRIMGERYNLLERYRMGYLVTPTIPWKATDMEREGVTSVLELSQYSMSVALISFDQNVGETYVPTAQVSVQMQVPVGTYDFGSEASLQEQFQQAYVETLNLAASLVSVEETPATGRRLLSSEHEVREYTVSIQVPMQNHEQALLHATELVKAFEDPESEVHKTLTRRIKALARSSQELPGATDFNFQNAKAEDIAQCQVDSAWTWNQIPRVEGVFTCTQRRVRVLDRLHPSDFDIHIGVRGPQSEEDWTLYTDLNDFMYIMDTQKYHFAGDVKYAAYHWLWYDFCGPKPAGTLFSNEEWTTIREHVTRHCCACRGPAQNTPIPWPKVPKKPIAEIDFSRTLPLNPQAITESSPVKIINNEVRSGCVLGAGLRESTGTCQPCVHGEYSNGFACIGCPRVHETTKTWYSTSPAACQCASGYTRVDGECRACPRGTFKSDISDAHCTACEHGLTSREGSHSETLCGAKRDVLFQRDLGVLAFTRPVHTEWNVEDKLAQSVDPLCIFGGDAVSCPDTNYATQIRKVVLSDQQWTVAANFGKPGPISEYVLDRAVVRAAIWHIPRGHIDMASGAIGERLSVFKPGDEIHAAIRLRVSRESSESTLTTPLYLVMMVTTQELTTGPSSRDWDWLVCGTSDAPLQFRPCHVDQGRNPHLVDMQITRLEPNKVTCYNPRDGLIAPCVSDAINRYNVVDQSLSWTPSTSRSYKNAWLYMMYLSGDSMACRDFSCSNAQLYRKRLYNTFPPAQTTQLELLAGFDVRHVAAFKDPELVSAFDMHIPLLYLGGHEALVYAQQLDASGPVQLELGYSGSIDQALAVGYVVMATSVGGDLDWSTLLCVQKRERASVQHMPLQLDREAGALRKNVDSTRQLYEAFYASGLFNSDYGLVSTPPTRFTPGASTWRMCTLGVDLAMQELPCLYTRTYVERYYSKKRPFARTKKDKALSCYLSPDTYSNTTLTAVSEACSDPADTGSCVCGVIFAGWEIDTSGLMQRRIFRAVTNTPSKHVYVTPLSAHSVQTGHVLAQEILPAGVTHSVFSHNPSLPDADKVSKLDLVPCPERSNVIVMPVFSTQTCCSTALECAWTCPGAGDYNPRTGKYTWNTNAPENAILHVAFVGRISQDLCEHRDCSVPISYGSEAMEIPTHTVHVRGSVSVRAFRSLQSRVRADMVRHKTRLQRRVHVGHLSPRKASEPRLSRGVATTRRVRKLLQVQKQDDGDSTHPAVMRETTGINTEQSMSDAVCKSGANVKSCSTVEFVFAHTIEEYCLPEADLLRQATKILREAVPSMASSRNIDIDILKVSRPHYVSECLLSGVSRRRRLLNQNMAEVWYSTNLRSPEGGLWLDFTELGRELYGIQRINLKASTEGYPGVQICTTHRDALGSVDCPNGDIISYSNRSSFIATAHPDKNDDSQRDAILIAIITIVCCIASGLVIIVTCKFIKKRSKGQQADQMGQLNSYPNIYTSENGYAPNYTQTYAQEYAPSYGYAQY